MPSSYPMWCLPLAIIPSYHLTNPLTWQCFYSLYRCERAKSLRAFGLDSVLVSKIQFELNSLKNHNVIWLFPLWTEKDSMRWWHYAMHNDNDKRWHRFFCFLYLFTKIYLFEKLFLYENIVFKLFIVINDGWLWVRK